MVPGKAYDVLIVGGGPAGMSAGIWCAELGLNTLLVDDKEELGGQLLTIYNRIDNYPGVLSANGKELRDLFLRSIERRSFEARVNAQVVTADISSKHVQLQNGETLEGRTMIIATGVRRRTLGLPGEVSLTGRGILGSGVGEREKVRGKRVVIIGGGDAALENCLLLSEFAREVILVHRRDSFLARKEFVDAVRKIKNVRFELESTVLQIVGNEAVKGVMLSKKGTAPFLVETDYVLIRIGVEPNSDLVRGQLQLDGRDYGVVDAACRTSIPGVFIAGDVANQTAPTIPTAVGMGAAAAKAAHEFLSKAS